MNSHESHSNRGTPQDRDHDPLAPDEESEQAGLVEQPDGLTAIIDEAISEAGPDREVPVWGARAMARYLATILGEPESALNDFAGTAEIDYERLSGELARLWQDHADSELTSEVINRLGTYLIAARREADPTTRSGTGGSERLQGLIAAHGAAFEAFLQLPEVTEQTAEATFLDSYYGSVDSIEALVQRVSDDHEVWQLLEDASLSHLASPDAGLLLQLAQARWDIVRHEGRLYLFEK